MADETSMRRTPKQARGKQRVDHLLDTAAQVFDEVGIEAASTNLIARRAGVSIGSLYQFFPNKEALFNALVERYAQAMLSVFTAQRLETLTITEIVASMVDEMLALEQEQAGFKAVFMTTSTASQLHVEIVGAVYAMLRAHLPLLTDAQCHETAAVGVGIVKGLMMLSAPPDNLPVERIAGIIKRALLAYLRAVLLELGHPLPPDLRSP